MKITKKLICACILLIFALNLISASKKKMRSRNHKNKSHHKKNIFSKNKGYDPSFSPIVLNEYLQQNVDTSKDSQKLLNTCISLVVESKSFSSARVRLYQTLEAFASDDKASLKYSDLRNFLKSGNAHAVVSGNTAQRVNCSEYIVNCLKPESELSSSQFLNRTRSLLQNNLGVYTADTRAKNNRLITSFASYNRNSELRSADLFKKLNARK